MSLTPADYRPIAETGIRVSPIGFGTVKLGRDKGVKYPQGFTIPDDSTTLAILNQAWELGINLIDTAPAYGRSEQRLGELLPKLPHEWIIATKAGEYFDNETGQSHFDFSPESIKQSVENSLKLLKRDVLDIVLIHSDGNDVEVIQQGALEMLNDLKQKGWVRATGMSTKTVEGGLLSLEQADIAMVMHNLNYQDELAVIEAASKLNKSIFIKKALGSGHIALEQGIDDIVQASFDMIFQHNSITSVIVGTVTPAHLRDNVLKAARSLKGAYTK